VKTGMKNKFMSKLSRPSLIKKPEEKPFGEDAKEEDSTRKSMTDFVGGYTGNNWLNFKK